MNIPEVKPEPKASDSYFDNERTILGLSPKEDALMASLALLIIGMIAIGLCVYMATRPSQPCNSPNSIACLDQRVQECIALKTYSKDQCITLVGGNK